MSSIQPLAHQEMNLSQEYWVKKFLYPFALDPAPLRISDYPVAGVTLGANLSEEFMENSKARAAESFNVIETKRYQFPISHIDGK